MLTALLFQIPAPTTFSVVPLHPAHNSVNSTIINSSTHLNVKVLSVSCGDPNWHSLQKNAFGLRAPYPLFSNISSFLQLCACTRHAIPKWKTFPPFLLGNAYSFLMTSQGSSCHQISFNPTIGRIRVLLSYSIDLYKFDSTLYCIHMGNGQVTTSTTIPGTQ